MSRQPASGLLRGWQKSIICWHISSQKGVNVALRLLKSDTAACRRAQAGRQSQTTAKESEALEWDGRASKLSEKLRQRLGVSAPKKPTVAADTQAEESFSVKIPLGAQELDLRETRPATGEFSQSNDNVQRPTSKIKSAEYIQSSLKPSEWPNPTLPEIAVIGRSNVGKSSLINMLTERKELALVSKTPGKTRTINHFLINKAWYLVDLPGYGYARTSKNSRFVWGKYTQQFFLERTSLLQVLLLIDATVPVQGIDLDCAQWLFEHNVPFSLVYTKLDKRKKKCAPPAENIAHFEEALGEFMVSLPNSVATSSTEKRGKSELLSYLTQLRLTTEV